MGKASEWLPTSERTSNKGIRYSAQVRRTRRSSPLPLFLLDAALLGLRLSLTSSRGSLFTASLTLGLLKQLNLFALGDGVGVSSRLRLRHGLLLPHVLILLQLVLDIGIVLGNALALRADLHGPLAIKLRRVSLGHYTYG